MCRKPHRTFATEEGIAICVLALVRNFDLCTATGFTSGLDTSGRITLRHAQFATRCLGGCHGSAL